MSEYKESSVHAKDVPPTPTGSRPAQASLSDRVRSLRLPEHPAAKRSENRVLLWSLALLCLALACGAGYLGYLYATATRLLAERSPDAALTPAKHPGESGATPGLPSSKADSVASSGEMVLERKGYVMAAHLILVSPKVSGMIEKLSIEEGMRVHKDQVLAVLETTDYQADYAHARATANSAWQRFLELYTGNRPQEIRQARAELDEMDAQRRQLYLEWKRNGRLQTNSALDAREYEQAEGAFKAMDRRVEKMRQAYALMLEGSRPERIEAAWADWEQAEADVAKMKWRLDNCIIRAPVSGTILTKKAEIGNLVNPIAFNGSFSLCEMADLSDMEVDMSIEERDVAKIFKGQLCKVRPEAFPERTYEGVVSRLMPTADRAKSAIPVRVKLVVPREEEGVYLKPDMGVVVAFLKKAG